MFGSNNDKPSAAEQMVAKLLGFTPEQMQQMITSFRDTIVAVADQLKRVEETQARILAILEAQNNVGRNDGNRDGTIALPGGGGSPGDASGSAGG